jgi:uncharacterized phage protein (TIGR01671 family)
MNRILKFRVWDKKYNKFFEDDDSNYGHGLTLDGEFAFCGESQFGYVDPKNKDRFLIQQFTGLKDKEGCEIYEGDIVSSFGGNYEVVYEWNFMEARFVLRNNNGDDDGFGWPDTREVVGNILESPELLNK